MKNKEASIWGWAKTNDNWTLSLANQADCIGRRIHKNIKLVTTSNNEATRYRQMGGVCTAMMDNIVGRHMESGKDDSNIDRIYTMHTVKPWIGNCQCTITTPPHNERKP
eukprot:8996429-Ditylum_brightwellii.AAC.1